MTDNVVDDDLQIYTIKSAAQRIKMSEHQVRRLVKKGRIRGEKVEGTYRIGMAALREFVQSIGQAS